MDNLAFDWFLIIRIFVCFGFVVLLGYFFTKGLSLFLKQEEEPIMGKDVDKVVNYMKDQNLKSCKVSMDKREIEISSDKTNVVRRSNRHSHVNHFTEEKRHRNASDLVDPLITVSAINNIILDTDNGSDRSSGMCSSSDTPSNNYNDSGSDNSSSCD
ncbi:hypothetical protein BKK39_12590 [Bacillus cereus]|uniref:hypothetical protein n=1 Tax=Bacillus cereus group TaxID=86661 RepID=UPI0009759E7F|nr:hypothetical protein [Bacillus cytotoxicus]ONG97457.1 hypothetical protein BKK39_12590 [Bacillus cereus]HDR7741133.1 hypothetical protein [Bacillus pacificus]MDH2866143.1 hypothetical protein [Bacillus cytotoxicus]NZD34385.1 hypothetical protein [Bacillus cytotoxicus]HDR7214411.1 hypothetical protein [Bacillus cytotoxicus]